jgi:hypothetical protein
MRLAVALLLNLAHVGGQCGTSMPTIDYAGPTTQLEMLDSVGQPTTQPFSNGGSARW